MQTQTQTQTPQVYGNKMLLEYIRKYINVESMTLKELGDLCLAIEHIIEWAIDNGYGLDDKISDIIETEVEEVE